MRFRKFLLSLRIFGRYRYFRRHFNRQKVQNKLISAQFTTEKEKLTRYYEKRLEVERQEAKSLLLALTDRALQAGNLAAVSHVTHNAEDKAEKILSPVEDRPFDPEKDLKGEMLNFYLDQKEGFWGAEAELGRSDADIRTLWETGGFQSQAVAAAQSQIIY